MPSSVGFAEDLQKAISPDISLTGFILMTLAAFVVACIFSTTETKSSSPLETVDLALILETMEDDEVQKYVQIDCFIVR